MTNTKQDLDAVLHWRGKHAAALKQRDELRQQLADITDERDLLALGIADAACKLGLTSEGVALTGPHLLMLLGDMVGMAKAAALQGEPVAWDVLTTGKGSWCKTVRGRETAEAAANRGFRIEPLYRKAPPATKKADEPQARLREATAFVQKLCDSATGQPSVATGYLRDILDLLKAPAKLNGAPA